MTWSEIKACIPTCVIEDTGKKPKLDRREEGHDGCFISSSHYEMEIDTNGDGKKDQFLEVNIDLFESPAVCPTTGGNSSLFVNTYKKTSGPMELPVYGYSETTPFQYKRNPQMLGHKILVGDFFGDKGEEIAIINHEGKVTVYSWTNE